MLEKDREARFRHAQVQRSITSIAHGKALTSPQADASSLLRMLYGLPTGNSQYTPKYPIGLTRSIIDAIACLSA
jgi:hypothetical protein